MKDKIIDIGGSRREVEVTMVLINNNLFTENEKVFLQSLNDKYQWITRDTSGAVYVHASEPRRFSMGIFASEYECLPLSQFTQLSFSSVTDKNSPVLFKDNHVHLLNDTEKTYLTIVLKPLPTVRHIVVRTVNLGGEHQLEVRFENGHGMLFPPFVSIEHYRCLKVDEFYTPEDLGLEI